MPYAVLRVAKIKTQAHGLAATAHNYRQKEVPNAERDEARPNREYLNHEKKDYWSLAEARIQEVGVKRVRSDSVRAMEVILTGSPEGFVRDKEGRAADYSKSKWAQDNLHFLQKQFGAKNVVSFTLHQDETTPHIHAVVVPITAKNTLSADQLFNPQSLRRLQTDYAAAMSGHGLSRGVEHSQAQHQPMRRLYGQEAQVSKQVAELSQAPAPAAFKLDDLPLVLFNREKWKQEQEARINAEITRQVQETQQRAAKLAQLAQGNTAAAERVKTLQKQLHTAEGLKQLHFGDLQTARQESTTNGQALDTVAVAYVQGGDLTQFREYGELVREQTRQALVATTEQMLRQPVRSEQAFLDKLQAAGYQVERIPEGKAELVHGETGARFPSKEILPNGRPLGEQLEEAIERTAKQLQQEKKSQSRGLSR